MIDLLQQESLSFSTFSTLLEQGFNRIPVVRKVLADYDTPLSAYRKLVNNPYSYLFESVHGGEKWGRYSIIGLPCKERIEVRNTSISRFNAKNDLLESVETDDPLTWIADYQTQFKTPELSQLPRFSGGLVGYFGYETIAYIEPSVLSKKKPDPLNTPDIVLMLSDEVVVFDNLKGKLYLIIHIDVDRYDNAKQAWDTAQEQLTWWVTQLQTTPVSYHTTVQKVENKIVAEEDFISGFTQQGFEEAVQRVKRYIVEGDAMQVVLSQRLSIPFQSSALDLYRALRCLNPSPYMFYLDLGDFHIVGSSPEILTRVENGKVTVRPIAGTRPRGETEAQDIALEADLLADPKELAEHLMLIDLGRNDVGRVANIGSVKLTEKMCIERYSHVMHIVSNVEGHLLENMSALDALRATFPAGTVSGAPKVRAMEIIDELEPVKRGIYSGAVGYLSWQGNMDTAIAIRTAVIKEGQLHIQAGAGIVADSIPLNEWQETLNKGRAIFKAVALVEAGLDTNTVDEKVNSKQEKE